MARGGGVVELIEEAGANDGVFRDADPVLEVPDPITALKKTRAAGEGWGKERISSVGRLDVVEERVSGGDNVGREDGSETMEKIRGDRGGIA
jgi:hypothetical protein